MNGSQIGTVVGERYELVGELGSGGMGTVFKAKHISLPKFFAVKILNSQLSNDASFRARFEQEAKTASLLNHPHLVAIYDHGTTSLGEAYLVMDFIDGRSLAEILQSLKRIDQRRAIKIFSQIADGLANAHRTGVIHRDLKPGNVMLIETQENPEFVKVVDFGIAKIIGTDNEHTEINQSLTKTGEFFGSPLYSSPEQGCGAKPDQRSDIYSLGILMYECLTGKPPFRGENFFATMTLHNEAQARPFDKLLGIDPELEGIVFTCLEKDPADRYQSMEEVKTALDNTLHHQTESKTSASPPEPLSNKGSTRKQMLLISCIGGIVAVSAAAGYLWTHNNASIKTLSAVPPPPASAVTSTKPVTSNLPAIPDTVQLPEDARALSPQKLIEAGDALKVKLQAQGPLVSLLPARYFTAAAEAEPGLYDAYEHLASYYWDQKTGKDPENDRIALNKCRAVFQEQLRQFPKNASVYGNISTIYVELNRKQEALDAINEAIKLRPDDLEFRLKHAYYLHSLGRYRESIAEYEKYMQAGDKSSLYVQAINYQASGQSQKAMSFASAQLKRDPSIDSLYLVRADAERDLGLYREAIKDYETWRKMSKVAGDIRLDTIQDCKAKLAAGAR
ncbi:MAG: protein kinase [Cyanobacteria bacterium SZAS LIN-2]|nr:protein kinase [Cyanobacteria bacterium SZAS LIN-2]